LASSAGHQQQIKGANQNNTPLPSEELFVFRLAAAL